MSFSSTSLALLTDLYQLTMAQGYFHLQMAEKKSSFYLSFRKKPFQGSYAIAAGISPFLEFIENFRYDPSDLKYLEGLKAKDGSHLFTSSFLDYLANLKLTCDIDAVEEGTVIFPYQPLVRINGPLLQAQLLETPLLNYFNFQTLIATKASRICLAAAPTEVVEFGVRRAQGIDGGISASRAAFIGGCVSSSNVLAGKLMGIPVAGTQAHSWIMAHETEEEAFENYAKTAPSNCSFLIDTFDSIEGVKNAIRVAKRIFRSGAGLVAVRIDSGDLLSLSKQVRELLDQASLLNVKIMATNDLDEFAIKNLMEQGAKIDIWGVGTNLVTGKDQPAFDGVYKLSALEKQRSGFQGVMKISNNVSKTTDPGQLQLRRYEKNGKNLFDVVFDDKRKTHPFTKVIDRFDPSNIKEIPKDATYRDLLIPFVRDGKVVSKKKTLEQIRHHREIELKGFDQKIFELQNPSTYFVGLEESLYNYKNQLIKKIKINSN